LGQWIPTRQVTAEGFVPLKVGKSKTNSETAAQTAAMHVSLSKAATCKC